MEFHDMGTAFGLTGHDDAAVAWFGNGVLARGTRVEAVVALRKAARAYFVAWEDLVPLDRDPCPPRDGLWWTFDPNRGAWFQGDRRIGSGLELLADLYALT